jgi:hypothetical protein
MATAAATATATATCTTSRRKLRGRRGRQYSQPSRASLVALLSVLVGALRGRHLEDRRCRGTRSGTEDLILRHPFSVPTSDINRTLLMSQALAYISDRIFLASVSRRATRARNAAISSATTGLGAAAGPRPNIPTPCGVLQLKQPLLQQVPRVRPSFDRESRSHLFATFDGIVDSFHS